MAFTVALAIVIAFLVAIVALSLIYIVRKGRFHWDRVTPHHLVDSYWISTDSLAIIRGVFTVYCVFILIFSFIYANETSFRFYTFWNFILLTIYFLCGTIHGMLASRNRQAYEDLVDPHTGTARFLFFSRFTWTLFQIVATTVFLVDVVVWTILYHMATTPEQLNSVLNFSSYNVHGANLVMLLVDLFLNRMTFNAAHCIFVMILPLIYATFQWIYHSFGGPWVYPFMATDTSNAAGWYVALMIMHLGFFFFAYFISGIRNFIVRMVAPAKLESEVNYAILS